MISTDKSQEKQHSTGCSLLESNILVGHRIAQTITFQQAVDEGQSLEAVGEGRISKNRGDHQLPSNPHDPHRKDQ